jgi:hypothetical protein
MYSDNKTTKIFIKIWDIFCFTQTDYILHWFAEIHGQVAPLTYLVLL